MGAARTSPSFATASRNRHYNPLVPQNGGKKRWEAPLAYLTAALLVAPATLSIVGQSSDFHTFFRSTLAWRERLPIPAAAFPNLNPPTFSLIFAPLTYLNETTALMVWTAIGIASIAASLVAIRRARAIPATQLFWTSGALIVSQPAITAWLLGQVTWVLLYPVTRAWLAADRSAVRSGLWLGAVIAIKPPFALFALLLPLPVMMVAAATSAGISALDVAISGWQPWRDWLVLGHQIDWYAWPINASLWVWPARWATVHSAAGFIGSWVWLADHRVQFSGLPTPGVVAILLILLSCVPLVLKAKGDRRWVLAFVWSLLASPLGWIYYLPVILGPLLGSWTSNRGQRLAFILLSFPAIWFAGLSPTAWLAPSICAISTVVAFAGWAPVRPRSAH